MGKKKKSQKKKIGKTERLQPFDFCYVTKTKGLAKKGETLPFNKGDVVVVASMKPMQDQMEDPYLLRIYSVVLLTDESGNILIPKEDNDFASYLIDPHRLEKLPEEDQERYRVQFEEREGAVVS